MSEPIRILVYQGTLPKIKGNWFWGFECEGDYYHDEHTYQTKAGAIRAARKWIKSLASRKVVIEDE